MKYETLNSYFSFMNTKVFMDPVGLDMIGLILF